LQIMKRQRRMEAGEEAESPVKEVKLAIAGKT
jgi:hypothetical protein